MPKRARKSYHHGDLRRVLIDAALAAIVEVGPENLSLRDLARRAGVSPAAPYRHFPDRDALLAAVAAECAERLGNAMQAAMARSEGRPPLAQYRATGVAYVRFAVEHPAHFRVMCWPGLAARVPGPLRAEMEAWKARERQGLLAAQKKGDLLGQPLVEVMLAAQCLMHGLAHLIVDGHAGFADMTPAEAEKLADALAEVLGHGLLPRDAASTGSGTGSRRRKR